MKNKGRKIKFKNWVDYMQGEYETLEGTITGETPKFYKIKTDEGREFKKKKSFIDSNLEYEARKKENLEKEKGLHVKKWEKNLLLNGEDFDDNIVRYYVKDGETCLGFFETKTIYKKRRIYKKTGDYGDRQYCFTGYGSTGEVKEVINTNNIADEGISQKYFSEDKPDEKALKEAGILI